MNPIGVNPEAPKASTLPGVAPPTPLENVAV